MRRLAVIGLVVVTLNGCASHEARHAVPVAVFSVGTASSVIGLWMLMFGYFTVPADSCDGSSSCDDRPALRRNGSILTLGGGVLMLGGFLGLVHDRTAQSDEADDRALAERRERTKQAWILIEHARTEADRGDCETVRNIGPRVARLNPVLHAQYFVHTSPLDVCLHAAAPSSASDIAKLAPTRDPKKDRENAFALTATARKAARAGDCITARDLERQVREFDADVHDAWFVRDDAIKACLTPTAQPVSPPTTAPVQPSPSAVPATPSP